MKCSLGISNFLEEMSSLSHSVVILYFFALIIEEVFLISPCYSLELYIQMGIPFLFSFAFCFPSFMYVYVWLIQFAVQQRLTQHYEASIFQFKKKDSMEEHDTWGTYRSAEKVKLARVFKPFCIYFTSHGNTLKIEGGRREWLDLFFWKLVHMTRWGMDWIMDSVNIGHSA